MTIKSEGNHLTALQTITIYQIKHRKDSMPGMEHLGTYLRASRVFSAAIHFPRLTLGPQAKD